MNWHLLLSYRLSTMIRTLWGCLAAVGLIAAMHSPATALVVAQPSPPTTWPATDVPPADDPGWSSVTVSGSRNYVYLGDGWALSARHVGPTNGETSPGMSPRSLTFSTGTFPIIPGQNYVIRNPATTINSSGQTVNLTTETDLRLVRLGGDPGLPSIFDENPAFRIATQAPPLSGEVVFIGSGRSRDGDLRHWIPSTTSDWTPTSPCASQSTSCRSGYDAMNPNDDTKRWGKNRLSNVNNFHNPGAFDHVLQGSTTTGILPLDGFGGTVRDVASLATSFDLSGTVNEAQAVDKDSGSAVFYKRNGQWELSGIVNAILTYDNQPGFTAVFGDATTIADLSFYYHPDPLSDFSGSISDVIRQNPNYSIIGDINLDGFVSGDGSGPWASDDVTAFAAGWMYQQAQGDITSWTNGDLNLNGITDVDDFFLLRGALQSAGAGAGIVDLNDVLGSSAGVPEPSSFSLALLGAALAAGGRRRRSSLAAASPCAGRLGDRSPAMPARCRRLDASRVDR